MTIIKPYLTFLTNLILATIGLTTAHFTNWIILISLLFGLGVPLVNINKPLKQKLVLTLVSIIASTAIFFVTILTVISFDFDKYIFPGIVVGIAGVLILGINGLLIKTIKLNFRTIALTFLLSGLSLPIWVLITENVFPKTYSVIEMVSQDGVMLFWMTMTTIGICLSIKKELTVSAINK
jgi:hypothetical protein